MMITIMALVFVDTYWTGFELSTVYVLSHVIESEAWRT